ncbi:MAG TPA: family 16 glycoside hydrolase [Planctomycetaceae bacterium]|nr:family 16 glycoside hydrolase [Planctomycetaceae bacterium]
MRRYCLCVILTLCIPATGPSGDEPDAKKPLPEGFVALYNAKDLSGWEVMNGQLDAWQAEGELLSCVAEGGGWLRTSRTYSDFVLKLDYRIPAGGNSGVGLRFPGKGNPAHDGMEIQILDDDSDEYKDLVAAQYTGGIYYQAAAKRGAAKLPGEWNTYEITCRGPLVKVVLNGQTINDVSIDEYTKGEGGHLALADRPEIGYVGLQSHGSRVDFRNLAIKDLTTTTNSGLSYVDIVVGKGNVVAAGANVVVHYTGRLADGKKFDSTRDGEASRPIAISLQEVILGWREGIPGMRIGGRRKLVIPAKLGYGEKGAGNVIPPDAMLIFDVEMVEAR